ncbi:MAG TPA: DNA polymerase I, partial [Chromatiales bacterium]|nr:DNA polymerase I [Chromatiales bacterium]
MTERKPLILVDGSGYLYRAYHALPPLTNSRGEPTGAVYGVANMLRRMLREHDPELVAVVFDAPGRTFRDELFERYKANRPPMPDDLVAQLEPLRELVEAMGLPRLEVPGVEADDVIGTLARRAAARGLPVVIATGDKDMAQLVDGRIVLEDTMRGRVTDRAAVEARFGVPPERVVDWLALVGDSSDNIPGVPRVGPKTAARWLRQYGSLDELVRHADEIPGKAGESLRAHLDQLALSRELARIRTDLELDVDPESLRRRAPDTARLRELLRRLEFTSWLKELPREETAASDAPPASGARAGAGAGDPPAPAEGSAAGHAPDYELVLDEAALERWLERLSAAPLFALDTETTSLDYMEAEVVGLAFAVAPGEAAYVPL